MTGLWAGEPCKRALLVGADPGQDVDAAGAYACSITGALRFLTPTANSEEEEAVVSTYSESEDSSESLVKPAGDSGRTSFISCLQVLLCMV